MREPSGRPVDPRDYYYGQHDPRQAAFEAALVRARAAREQEAPVKARVPFGFNPRAFVQQLEVAA